MSFMDPTIVVGLLSLAGTLCGSLLGILTANKLSNYRIAQLERTAEKLNSVLERIVVLERDLKTAFCRIDEVKELIKRG